MKGARQGGEGAGGCERAERGVRRCTEDAVVMMQGSGRCARHDCNNKKLIRGRKTELALSCSDSE